MILFLLVFGFDIYVYSSWKNNLENTLNILLLFNLYQFCVVNNTNICIVFFFSFKQYLYSFKNFFSFK